MYGGKAAGGVYWFITVLLISKIVIALIENHIKKTNLKLIIYISLYFLAVLESVLLIPAFTIDLPVYVKFPWNIDVCLIAIPYMVLGYYAKLNGAKLKTKFDTSKGKLVIVASFIVVCTCLYVFKATGWFNLDMKYTQYKNPFLDLLIPVIFVSIFWVLSTLIKSTFMGKLLAFIGQKSLTIMYLHLLIRDKIFIGLFGNQYPVLVYVLVTIALCSLCEYILSMFPKIAPYFGIKVA